MRDESVARNYAEALLELADRHEGVEVFGEWMHSLAEMVGSDPRLRLFLETPRVDATAKKEVLEKALGSLVPRAFLNFLLVTIDKRRQRLLSVIDGEYQKLLDARLGRERVDVTVARQVSDEEKAEISSRLTLLLGKVAIPVLRVRPEILGGIVVRSGDLVYDGSVRHRLDRLRRRMLTADLFSGDASAPLEPAN